MLTDSHANAFHIRDSLASMIKKKESIRIPTLHFEQEFRIHYLKMDTFRHFKIR